MRLITHSLLSAVFLLCLPAPVKQAAHVKPPLTDFEARCYAPGVVRCFGFDSKALVLRHIYPAWDAWYRGEMVTDIKASGAGSLRFTIPPSSPDNTSGQFWLEFADNFSVQFGQVRSSTSSGDSDSPANCWKRTMREAMASSRSSSEKGHAPNMSPGPAPRSRWLWRTRASSACRGCITVVAERTATTSPWK